ncbi:LLM class flavin-dependent oxidoreductase [Streptomyces mirabilis]|uniref:LLM class flavin-dependent oxidoreductase n=1 Tax=Streptomyces mirabilis TaxID=68239 RepID=UPI0033F0848C
MVTVYSTCPGSTDRSADRFRRAIRDVARWTEDAGCRGLLVYTDNRLVDPWAAAQFVLERTERLVPLVAVQPVYMHPFTVARMVRSIDYVYGRQVDLNMVTGGYAGHLQSLASSLDHDSRYDRLVEYGGIVQALLTSDQPVVFDGKYYQLHQAALDLPRDAGLTPRTFVAGSSPACVAATGRMGATRLAYPRWIEEYGEDHAALSGTGIRMGIIARDTTEAAWRLAHDRFPPDPRGERVHDISARMVESQWHRGLSADARRSSSPREAYWLYPFRTYKTFCPYLVGSYEEVAGLLRRYLDLGVTTLVLDEPAAEDDLHHASRAIRLAERLSPSSPVPTAQPDSGRGDGA